MDLDNLFERAFDGFGQSTESSGFPGVPGDKEAAGNDHVIDKTNISRCSRFSRSEMEGIGSEEVLRPEKTAFCVDRDRANVSPQKTPGNTGTPGTGTKTLAETTLSQFPVKDREPGTPGTEAQGCERPLLDLNSAKPQRSDWWTGAAMADVDRAAPPPGDPLPISPSDVRAGVARELRALAEDGREGPHALRDAIEIVRAKIRNSEVLAERQAHGGRCHVCDGPLDDSAPVVAVMTGKCGSHLHLHAGCCGTHSARMTALVDRIMASAGYGETLTNGEAA